MAKQLNVNVSVTADTSQARAALQQLQSTLTQLSSSSNLNIDGNLNAMTQDILKAKQVAGELGQQLRNATNVDTGKLDLVKFSNSLKQSGMTISAYRDQLLTLGSQGERAFTQLASSILKADAPLRKTSSLFSELKTTLVNTARWQFSSSLLHGFMGTIQSAYGYAQRLNESLTNIQIVTQASDEHMARFAEQANKAAKTLSTTTTSYTDAALIYYQQGLNDKQVKERTDVTIKMANAAGVSAQKVSDQMTAVWNNFDDGSHSLEYYADVMTALGAATASSTDEISTGLQKFASVADTVGLSYENAAAALATITATTRQSADSVGTGLRTLFSRLQSLNLGETLDDGVTLTKYTKALETIGVSALDASGNLRSMDDILEDMGGKWKDLSDAQKTALAQTVGGVRQYTTLIALMDNFDFYKQNQQVALNSEGTVQKQADIYAKSWEAAQKRVKASAESIYTELLNDDFFIGFNNVFAKALNGVNLFIKGIGGLKGVLMGVFALATRKEGNAFANMIDRMVYNINGLTGKNQAVATNLQQQTAAALQMFSGEGSGLGGITAGTLLGQQGTLYQTLVAEAEHMSEAQQQIAAYAYDGAAAMNEEAIAQARAAEAAAEQLASQSKLKAMTQLTKGATQAELEAFYNQTRNAGAMNTTANALLAGINSAKIRMAMPNADPNAENVYSGALLTSSLTRMATNAGGAGLTALQAEIESMISKIEARVGPDGILNLQNDLTFAQELEALLNKIVAESEAIRTNNMGNTFNGQQLFKKDNQAANAGQAAWEAGQKEGAAGNATDAASENMRRTTEQIKAINQTPITIGQKFSNAVSGVMSLGMAITTVKGLIDTWNNQDLSIGEKLTATMTSGAMAVMMLANSWKMLNMSQLAASISSKLVKTDMLGIMAGDVALTGANHALAASFMAVEAATGSAAIALVAVLAIIAATVATLIAIGSTIARLIVTPSEHLNSLTQSTDDAKEAAQEAKEAYDQLINDFDNHNSLLDSLNEMKSGTLEFQQALIEANTAATELINKYGILNDEVSIGKNGEILISDEARKRVQQEALNKVTRTQDQYVAAQAMQSIGEISQDLQTLSKDVNGNDIKSTIEQMKSLYGDAWAETMAYANQSYYDNYADKYGFANGEELLKSIDNGSFSSQAYIMSGVASKSGSALRNLALKDGALSDIESLLIDQLSMNPDFWNNIYDQAGKVLTKSYNGRALESLTNGELQKVFREGAEELGLGQEALNELLSSDAYKEADKKGRIQMLRSAIQNANSLKVLQDAYDKQQEQLLGSQIAKYSNYQKLNAAGIQKVKELTEQSETGSIEQLYGQQILDEYAKSVDRFQEAGIKYGFAENNGLASQFADFMKSFSMEDMDLISGLTEQFEQSTGPESAKKMFNELVTSINNGNSRVKLAAKDLNLSGDIIKDLSAVSKAFKGLEKDIDIKGIKDSMKRDAGGKKGIFEELYNSEDFKDNLKDLQKSFKKTGKIGADAILDMAEESEYLMDMLDESDISAQALADTLMSLEVGDIGLDSLTDSLLEAFTAAGEVENTLAEVFNYIDNFEQERSTQDIGKFYKGLSESVKSAWEMGQVMDPQALQAWGEMFGPESLANYRKFMAEVTNDNNLTPQQISDKVNAHFADEVAAMQSIQKYGDLSGMFEYYDKKGVVEGGTEMFSYNKETGQVTTAGGADSAAYYKEQGWDSESGFIQGLMDNYGITEQMAKSMAAEYASTNAFLSQIWHETAAQNGIEKLIGKEGGIYNPDTKQYEINGKATTAGDGVTTAKELEAFYNQYQDVLKDAEGNAYDDFNDFLSDMSDRAEKTGQSIVDLGKNFKYTEADLNTLKETMDASKGLNFDEYMEKVTGTADPMQRSFADLENAFTRLGYNTSEAYKLIDQQIQEQMQGGQTWSDAFKEQFVDATTVGQEQWNRFKEYLNTEGKNLDNFTSEDWANFLNIDGAQQQMAENAKIMANAITDAFSNLDIKIDLETGQVTIKPKIDESSVADAGTEAGETISDAAQEAADANPVELNFDEKADAAIAEALAAAQADLDAQIAKVQADAQKQVKQAQADAVQQIKDAQTSAAEAIQAAQEAADAQAQAMQTAAEEALTKAEAARDEARSLQEAADAAKAEAEAARDQANQLANDASVSAEEAQAAEARASSLETAAQTAQDAADAAASNAAAQAAAAQAAAAAAEAALTAAASLVGEFMAAKGEEVRDNLTPGSAMENGASQYSDTQLGWLTSYAQYSAANNNGVVQPLNSFTWSDFAQNSGIPNAPSWFGKSFLGLFGADSNFGNNGVSNWQPSLFTGASDEWGGFSQAWLQGLSDLGVQGDSAGIQALINAAEQVATASTETASNTATSAEVAEGQAKGDNGANTQRRVGDFSVTEVGGEYHAKNDSSNGSSDNGYDMKGFQYESKYTGGDTGKESVGDTTALVDSIKALGTDIKAGQEAAATTSTAKADAKVNAKATLSEVEVNTTAEVPVEAENPEQVVEDVQAEAEGNPVETTATVTEVESDIEMEDQEATVDYDKGSQEEPEDEEAKVNYVRGTQQPPVDMSAAVNYVKGSQEPPSDMTATVNYVKGSQEGPGGDAGGYNNGNGSFFASGYGGNHIAGAYQGLATVGELGPELMIHGNQAFLVGINGRTTAYVHPDDTIYTAAETQKIMSQNPTLQDLPGFAGGYRWPGFSVGYSRISWGSTSPGSGSSKAPKAAAKQRSKDFDPERYHYQTRVIADLNRYLERMNKLKDHAYGSHRIRAIRNEITATEDLIKANEKLLDEANKYLEGDRKAAADLGAQFDNEGNIINWDELQEKYARPAAEDSENEEAKKNWKLIQQYEETIDKIHDTVAEIDDLRWSLSDLVNEEIEAKVDVKIDMDDRELDLLDYYLDKVKDNIDKTKDAIGIVNGELGVYTDEISTYQKVMDDLLRNARNAQGDKITGLTLDKWMKMTPQQRDALDIDYDLGKKLEEYSEEILDAMKKIQDLKLYAVDALNQAFEELNNNVQESTELFDHYGSLLESLKDISDLQGTIMNKDLQKAMDSLNKSMLNNTKNSIKAQQDYYKELSENAKVLKDQIANAQDWQVKEALQEQLDNIETLMRDAEQNILGLWQDGLSKAQEMFEFAIENITKEYEKAIAGAYANVDGLKEAYERQQTVNGQYVDDYERMYQLSKLQRTINRDLDAAAVNGNRHNKNLKALLTEIEGLQANGQEMSEYDLELLQKRYEYEKALADLEDARNAKQTVRLQRDRNGNWGYVYTAADDEELAKQEQAVEDKLYEWQKFEMESIDEFSSQLFDLQTEYGEKLSNIMSATWDSDEDRDTAIANLDAWYKERLEYLNKYLNTAFDDANSTIDRAKKRYDTDQFEIIDTFGETTLGMINNTVQTTEELIANLQDAMNNMKTAAQDALTTYSDTIIEFNKLVEESNELFAEYANGQATSITRLSDDQLGIVQKNIKDMADKLRTGNDAMLVQVEDFNKKYYEKFNDPETGIITTNEKFLDQLQDILSYLNRIDYAVDSNATIQKEVGTINSFSSVRDNAQSAARFDTGGYTGSWGTYGKFAILDQKEQVFNAEDTKNLLDAAHILRTLDVQSGLFSKGLGDFFAPYVKDLGQTIEQDVHITAEFPNATNRTEIEEAFNNLVNRATQYANRKAG